jgi:hypothetical protein
MRPRSLIVDLREEQKPSARNTSEDTYERVRRTLDEVLAEIESLEKDEHDKTPTPRN